MTPAVLRLARALIAREIRDQTCEERARAAFQVCAKLRLILDPLVGEYGIQALYSRALKLATKEVPWLAGVRIRKDASVEYLDAVKCPEDGEMAVQGGEFLLAHILWLLLTLIGKGLTLRLVHDVWPDAPDAPELDTEENS